MRSLKAFFSLLILFIISLSAYAFTADSNLHPSQDLTPISCNIFNFPIMVFWICIGISIVVFAVFIYCLMAHHKSRRLKPTDLPKQSRFEIIWAIIPLIIFLALVIPATHNLTSNCIQYLKK